MGGGRLGDKKKLTSKSHPILEPNIGTCSRAIWDQQASLPTRAMTGVWNQFKKRNNIIYIACLNQQQLTNKTNL